MTQPQAYNRETDFTERDGDDTNHAGINTELDAAALSINQLRDNLALIQADDGGLKAGIVTAESLDDSAFDAILVDVNLAVSDAQTAAESANIAALSANAARDQAVTAKENAETANNAAALNASTAASKAAETASAVAQAVDGEKDLFVAGVNYTKGTTTQLTLAYTPAKSGTVKVFFDGVFQHLTEWSLAGNVITFTAAIPANKVEVHYVIPSQFVGLSNADLLVLGEAESSAQAGAASAQADAATAAAAKTAAEAARDATLAAAIIYPSTAAGLAGTTTGKYFYVPSADANESLILYLNNAGVAVDQKHYPSVSILTQLLAIYAKTADFTTPNTEQPLLLDAVGNVLVNLSGASQALQILVDLAAKKLSVTSLAYPNAVITDLGGFSNLGYGLMDAAGKIVEIVNQDGGIGQRSPSPRGAAAASRFPAEINHFIMNGQSLSVRNGLAPEIQDATDLMFSGGVDLRVEETGNTLVALVANGGECILNNAIQQMKFLMKGGNSYSKDPLFNNDYTLLPSSHGTSGATIESLAKGGAAGSYEDAMFGVDEGVRLAGLAGKSYAVQAFNWIQGESNRGDTAAVYLAKFLAMLGDYRGDIIAKTGQPNAIKTFVYQPSGNQYDQAVGVEVANTIADAFFQASESDPDILIASPTYWVKHDDALHFASNDPDGGQAMGMKWGEVLYRVVFRGEDWRPTEPTRILALNSTTVMVYFNVPEPPLVLDTVNVVNPGQYGFDVRDAGGTIAISSVTVVNGCAVKLKLARAITTLPVVSYAYYGVGANGGGPTTGARGNLRDSANTRGFNGYARLWNWAVAFKKAIPYVKP